MEDTDLHREHKIDPGAANRITTIIEKHWQEAKKDKDLPSQQDLDPNILEPLLDNCYLVQASAATVAENSEYRYIGKNITEAYGSHVTHPKDHQNSDPLSHKSKFVKVIKTRKPLLDEGEFINKHGQLIKYRQCIVPLAKDGRTVDAIFGGIRFKVFTDH